ncbi:MAG: sigma-70 family RNA polymerase sigma factor [Sedimentisphaerales bacterium]|nr:sigma-70 family RNA polymerase sigma factor [Sedimentisphaerales bacterium]
MGSSDENLMAAHVQGDPAAFCELVRRYGDGVLGYLYHMTGNRSQAEDLFQETFKRVHEKAHTFRGGRFKSWLFTIATRAAIDSGRRRRRMSVISLDQNDDCDGENPSQAGTLAGRNAIDPADELVKEEQRQQVRRAIEALPVKQRATLVLAYYQQLSYSEVAEAMGCSLGTVKTQMSRALAALARTLPDSIGVTK